MKHISSIAAFVKYNREKMNLTQEQLADLAGVGIHFLRNLEQGHSSLKLDKVNQVLKVFGHILTATPEHLDPYQLWFNYMNKAVRIIKKNREEFVGFIIREIRDEKSMITGWRVVPNPNAIEWQKKQDDKLTIIIKHSDIAEIKLQER